MRFLRRILRPVFCCSALCSRAQSGEEKLSVPRSAVVYFSHTGNTRTVAEHIAELTGADLFEIKSLTQYPNAYYPSTHFVKKEIESGILPEIEPIAVDLSDYEVIFVGSPTWWHHIAGVVQRWLLIMICEVKPLRHLIRTEAVDSCIATKMYADCVLTQM